ncbi:TldD/PmbA family protein [bacterium]|nr:TldD/PmbA family protein [bacterium]
MSSPTPSHIVEHLRVLISSLPSLDFAEASAQKIDYKLLRSTNASIQYEKQGTEYRVLIKLLKKGRLSSVIGKSSEKSSLADLVHQCYDGLKFSPQISDFSQAPFKIKNELSNIDWSDSSLDVVEDEEKAQRLRNIERKILSHDKRITQTNAYYDEKIEDSVFWTTGAAHPLRKKISKIDIGAESSAENESGPVHARSNDTQTHYYNLDWKLVATRCAKRCISRIGAQPVSSGVYRVLLSSRITQKLVCSIFEALRADMVKEDRSFLAGVFGQRIFSDAVTITDDPFLRARTGNALWDDQGTPTQRCVLIEKGKVISFAHNLQTAKTFRVRSTGHAKRSFETGRNYVGAHNLYMEPSRLDQVDLISQVTGGLYLVETQSPLTFSAKTGDFKLKARGYKVLGNEKYEPIEGAVIKSNFREILSNILFVGRDLKWGEHYGAPSFVVESLRVEGE